MRPLSEANMASPLGHTWRRRRAAAASGVSHAGSFRWAAEMSTGSISTARAGPAEVEVVEAEVADAHVTVGGLGLARHFARRLAGRRSCVKTRARMLPGGRGLLVLGARAGLRRGGARLARGERAARLAPRPLLVARRRSALARDRARLAAEALSGRLGGDLLAARARRPRRDGH